MSLGRSRVSGRGPYVAGERFSLVDIALGMSLHRWRNNLLERFAASAIEAYLERLVTRFAWACYASDATF